MPSTSSTPVVTQVLPNFNAAKNGTSANEVNTNKGFNQILKNEVANKIKKAPANNTKPLASNQVEQAPLTQKKSAVNSEASHTENTSSSTNEETKDLEDINSSIIDETNTLLNFVGDLNSLVRPTEVTPDHMDDALTKSSMTLDVSLSPSKVTAPESTLASNKTPVELPVAELNLSQSIMDSSLKSDTPVSPDNSKINSNQSAENALKAAATELIPPPVSSSPSLPASTTAISANLISSNTGLDVKPVVSDKNKSFGISMATSKDKTPSFASASEETQLSNASAQTDVLTRQQKITSNIASADSSVPANAQREISAQTDLTAKAAPMLGSMNSNIEPTSVPATMATQASPSINKQASTSEVDQQNTIALPDDLKQATTVLDITAVPPPSDPNKNLAPTSPASIPRSEVNTNAVVPANAPESPDKNKNELTSVPVTEPLQEVPVFSKQAVPDEINQQNAIVVSDDINQTTKLNVTTSTTHSDLNKNLALDSPATTPRSEVNTKAIAPATVLESPDLNKSELASVPATKPLQETPIVSKQILPSDVDQSNTVGMVSDFDQVTTASDKAASPQLVGSDKNLNQAPPVEKLTPASNTQQLDSVAAAVGALAKTNKGNPQPADDTSETSNFSSKNTSTELISDFSAEDYRPELKVNEHSASDKFSMALKTQLHETQRDNLGQDKEEQKEFKITDIARTEPTHATPPTQAPIEAASVSAASNFIGARVGSRAWDQAIGQKIVWMVAGGEQSAQLTLNPPDLGPIQVVLSISDSQVDASFVSSHLDVREAIEAAAPKLREMMDNAGMTLSGFSVNAQSTPADSGFSSNNDNRSSETKQRQLTSADTDNSVSNIPAIANKKAPLGLVDTFV